MANYRINEDAKADLQRIYRRGVLEFGEEQADRYFDAFFERFDELAVQPYQYQAVDEIRSGYRRSVCGVDSIYYRIVGSTVEIMRILGQQDIDDWL
ncbi:type II toxin-antitoxin system RelE/ParE family toxin [Lentisalinibacter orientalis]|uniref:type II toxin-antitoxin system RelE/ParE family toxin n=1 Tax=Lentisalinibacter orientalis TaxID=2992241 RepID=UPI003865D299